ncbi:hypothetical protein [Bifidobacterium eulemuris]|uniref:Uncharacterized protein n=1 Tax=Bifidobacterium eulemuris TaxID=1765219 RepID=A0A261GDW4_9BIFI|nr:hypothetical protein [Bifidobacterium eulemuris]OZG69594.1 hypothetical protein BEUL_0011 [Bifidobacterium eulemuris]QOL32289.1 hypothetical protein BE0216_07335 [Bifidobacterium eulemuris]
MVGALIRCNRRDGDRVVKVYGGPEGYCDVCNDPGFKRDMGKIGTDWEIVALDPIPWRP